MTDQPNPEEVNRPRPKKRAPFVIAGESIAPGEHRTVDVTLAPMYTHHNVEMTTHVIHGRRDGPVMFVSAAIHGDEINGVEIIRRLLKQKQLNRLRGTLLLIPIVNVYGFLNNARYLPDGRDLNRSFPGSPNGSLAARIAHKFFTEVVEQCTHGIDLHTGARHRSNLPQIRADLSNEKIEPLASAFGVPVIIDSKIRDGSLRGLADERGIPLLLYEAGEALRFDELCIRAGVRGVLNVMRQLDMLPRKAASKTASKASTKAKSPRKAIISRSSSWVRAPNSGVLRALVPLGAKVEEGNVLGMIGDPLGTNEYQVVSPSSGIVIGRTYLPLVHQGEALFHIAHYDKRTDKVFDEWEAFQEKYSADVSLEPPENPEDAPIQ